MTLAGPPLMGLHWNEAEVTPEFNNGLLTIVAFDVHGVPHPIGAGFVIALEDAGAICMSAAHVFHEIRRLQNPQPRHHATALREFLPKEKPIDLGIDRVAAISVEEDRVEFTLIDKVVIDRFTDIAVFSVKLRESSAGSFFNYKYDLDSEVPEVGSLVCMLSYGNMGIYDFVRNNSGDYSFRVSRRPTLRVGRVLEKYPGRHRLSVGPCVETSIPIYSGMSGGPVFRYAESGPMRAFGVVCCDPDPNLGLKQDRCTEGRSIIASIPSDAGVNVRGESVSILRFLTDDHSGWR